MEIDANNSKDIKCMLFLLNQNKRNSIIILIHGDFSHYMMINNKLMIPVHQ